MSASRPASWSSPSMATVAPWSAATARSVSAKATSGWNAPIWVPAAIAGARTSAPSAPLVWIIAWPLYIRSDPASRRDRVVGDGQDDQLDLVEDRLRVGEGAGDVDQRAEPLAPGRVAAGDRVDRPAAAGQRDPERRPDRARPDDADDRRLARAEWTCGWAWSPGASRRRGGGSRAAADRGRCRRPRWPPPASRCIRLRRPRRGRRPAGRPRPSSGSSASPASDGRCRTSRV